MILHTVNKSSHSSSALQRCLAVMQDGDTLLLIEDGVYDSVSNPELTNINYTVLLPDAEIRGIASKLPNDINTVDYDGFVELVASHKLCQSWF